MALSSDPTASASSVQARRLALLEALEHPEHAFRVVHVGGTNGKGSTVALMAAVLQAAGYRVGRFTSPDLSGPHERFWIDGACLTPAEHAALEASLQPAFAEVEGRFPDLPPLRPFDRWCAEAWCWFRDRAIDVAVVEVGLGGRQDATNVFLRPECTLITSIGADHQGVLGTDLPGIAREKAGIFRATAPAATTASGPALEALAAAARALGTPLRVVRPLSGEPTAEPGWRIARKGAPALNLPLAGAFQLENAALAIVGLDLLAERGWQVPDRAIQAGFAAVRWPGRMEHVPDALGGSWLLDGAHNEAAVHALCQAWAAPEVVVTAIQGTKDARPMVEALSAGARPLVVLPLALGPSWTAHELAAWAAGQVYAAPDLPAALALARAIAPHGSRCVTGSLHLVGAARAILVQGAT